MFKQRTCKDKKLSTSWQKAKIDLSEEVRLIKEMIAEVRPAVVEKPAEKAAVPVERGARKREASGAVPAAGGEDYLPQWAKEGKFSRGGVTADLKQGSTKKDAPQVRSWVFIVTVC